MTLSRTIWCEKNVKTKQVKCIQYFMKAVMQYNYFEWKFQVRNEITDCNSDILSNQ